MAQPSPSIGWVTDRRSSWCAAPRPTARRTRHSPRYWPSGSRSSTTTGEAGARLKRETNPARVLVDHRRVLLCLRLCALRLSSPYPQLRGALPEGEVHHHLAAPFAVVPNGKPPRVVAPGLRAPLHPALSLAHCQVALGVERAPSPPGYSSVVRILSPGTPSAEGPSNEESTTGGRLPTCESQVKTSSGGASMVRLCSYSCWATVLAPFVAGTSLRRVDPRSPNSIADLLTGKFSRAAPDEGLCRQRA